MTRPRTRGWYWKEHGADYQRASVGTDIEEFVGWDTLLDLIKECEKTEYAPSPAFDVDATDYRSRLIRRDQALIAALFLTGGRANEVVELRVSNFDLHTNPEYIYVRGMKVSKRYRKLETIKHSDGTRSYVTEPMDVTRGVFTLPRDEPLVPYLEEWIQTIDDYLFPSPTKKPHLSRQRAYQIVKEIGKRVGIEIWVHWFRSQRASQLVQEHEFNIHLLADWFRWTKLDTARTYTKLNPSAYNKQYEKTKHRRSLQQQLEEQQKTIDLLITLVPPEKLQEAQI